MPVPREHMKPTLENLYDHLDDNMSQGTDAELTAGTSTTPRTWSAKQIADYVAAEIAAIP